MLTCQAPDCNNVLSGKQRKFCNIKCKHTTTNNKFQNYEAQKLRGLTRKIHLVNLKGGACYRCGYKKNLASLCFHHREEDAKELKLDLRHLSNNSMKAIMIEFEKCELVCHNCHMEIHHVTLDNWWDYPDSNREPSTYEVGALTN